MTTLGAINRLLAGNKAYSERTSEANPEFFPKLATGQAPEVLWLGCADSRVPETTVCACQPGDIFVHRNIANIIQPGDASSQAILDFAVGNIKVKQIILCGHTQCGGANAALGDADLGENLNGWLRILREIRKKHQGELDAIESADAKATKLAELNVLYGLKALKKNATVAKAMESGALTIHGYIFDISKGQLRAVEHK